LERHGSEPAYPVGSREEARLIALRRLAILDTAPTSSFDRLCEAACDLFSVPIALVSLIDADRQWFKAEQGLGRRETPRELAFCNHTILHDEVFIVPDAQADARFARNSLVTGAPGIRFYAGAPLIVGPDLRLGSLCIIDRKPRDLYPDEVRLLKQLARVAVDELWLHQLTQSGLTSLAREMRLEPLDFSIEPVLTGAQVRAARGLLNWSVAQLAEAAEVSVNTIKRIETQDGVPGVRGTSLDAVADALKAAGIAFDFAPGRKPGVRPM
jgi:GAF domain-containing protein